MIVLIALLFYYYILYIQKINKYKNFIFTKKYLKKAIINYS